MIVDRRKRFSIAFFYLSFLSLAFQPLFADPKNPDSEIVVHFEDVARSLVVFRTGDFLFGRYDAFEKDGQAERLKSLIAASYPTGLLMALLKHHDAKVRTLALACLFDKEDPLLLPEIVSMAKDNAETFPLPTPFDNAAFFDSDGKLASNPAYVCTEFQTVGDIAKKMVSFYMERAGYYYGIRHRNCAGFDKYWDERKNRTLTASWLVVKMDRARKGSSAISKDSEEKLMLLRNEVEQLAQPERSWYLFFMGTHEPDFGKKIISEEELLKIVKTFARSQLRLLLEHKVQLDDPDFNDYTIQDCHAGEQWRGRSMRNFVLKNAGEFLQPDDAKYLLQNDHYDDSQIWAIAAATLRPQQAEVILKEAMQMFSGRNYEWDNARLVAALFGIVGQSQTDFVLNWFYNLANQENMTTAQQIFIDELKNDEDEIKEFLTALISDDRFMMLHQEALAKLVVRVNVFDTNPFPHNPYLSQYDDEGLDVLRSFLRSSINEWKLNHQE